jgi:hypothetical protein
MKRFALFAIVLIALVPFSRAGQSNNVVDRFTVKLWNGAYYASVKFPNGQTQELKSVEDLNFVGWQKKITAAWDAIQNPPAPPEPVTLDAATKEQIAAQIKKLGLTAKDLGL